MDTLTQAPEPGDDDAGAAAPYLFVVLSGAAPLEGGARLALDTLDHVEVGRGEALGVEALGRPRAVALRVPDRRMSTVHATLARTLDGWRLVDPGSKNGTRVDGAAVREAELEDGAVIELGQTVLVFRAALASAEPGLARGDGALGIPTLVPALAAEYAQLARVAPSRVPLVLGGETGTGKEVVARAVHAASGRAGPFVAINCGALPATLVESALFGHRRGAFSGAIDDAPGAFRAADGGTLLLDELGDLALPAQAALLRVLQEQEVVPVGATSPIPVDVRVIAASHRDLAGMVAQGELRADLYARLAGYQVTLPPLRARREDIGLAVAAALRRHGARAGVTLTLEAAARLVTAAWPLNLRELDHAIEVALALAGDAPIALPHLPDVAAAARPSDDQMRAELVRLLRAHHGNVSAVARELGKARMQIQRWMRRWKLDPASFR